MYMRTVSLVASLFLVFPLTASAAVTVPQLPTIPSNPTISDFQTIIAQLITILTSMKANIAEGLNADGTSKPVSIANSVINGTIPGGGSSGAVTLPFISADGTAGQEPASPATSVTNSGQVVVNGAIKDQAKNPCYSSGGDSYLNLLMIAQGEKPCPAPSNAWGTSTTNGLTGAACVTPWGNVSVQSGQYISFDPYFSGGARPLQATSTMEFCVNGSWQAVWSLNAYSIDRIPSGQNSCTTPADKFGKTVTVQSGETLAFSPYFTGVNSRDYNPTGFQELCLNGAWKNVYNVQDTSFGRY